MSINLVKGQRISLSKESPGLTRVLCGLGWDVNPGASGGLFGGILGNAQNYDLDASVLCLDGDDKLRSTADIIYFGNLRHASGAITHLGDNLTGEGSGDDEQISVDLPAIPLDIAKLVFTVNIYKCRERKQDFGKVKNAFVRLANMNNNQEVARYNLSGAEYQGMTGLIIAEVYRHDQEWKMAAIGQGVDVGSLKEIADSYH